MNKFNFTFIFSIFLFSLLILKVESNSYSDSLEIVAQFNIIKFKINSTTEDCKNCMPAGIKISSDGTIFCSFPRWYDDVTATFAKYNKEMNYFEPWPSIEMNQRYKKSDPSGINSVLGFEIDINDTLYILDQGKIRDNAASEGSIKLLTYSLKNNSFLREYVFNSSIADPDNSFLNDIVIDQKKNIAYISDSGIARDKNISHYDPGIIVLDLNTSIAHRILSKQPSVFPDESFWLHVEDKPVKEDNPMLTGVDGIALSCNGDTLFFCPLTGRMIYSILTIDIEKAIKENKLNDIPIYEGFKKEASDGLLASSKGNLYMTGIETGSIYISKEIEQDLLRFDYKNFDIFKGNTTTMWPDTLAMKDGYLYFVSNQLNNFPDKIDYLNPQNGKYNFAILRFKVDDESYLKGCSGVSSEWGPGSIIIWICFAVIILIVLSFVLMVSNNQEEVIDKHMNLGIKDY